MLGCLLSVAQAQTLRTVAISGDPAPGAGSGASFFDFEGLVLNDAGQVAFLGELTGTEVVDSNSLGIWSEGGGSGLALVARSGSAAPDVSSGVYFGGLGNPVLNNVGQTAFAGGLVGEGAIPFIDNGIWSEGGGSGLALVARAGKMAPGAGGANFRFFFTALAFNDAGQTAFFGLLDGTNNTSGVWSEGGGAGLALVARGGDVAPGTSGTKFSTFNISSPSPPAINNAGQTAFGGNLASTKRVGIWSEGGGAGLALVAREGNVAPGTGGENFVSSGFDSFSNPILNDLGQTAFSGFLPGRNVNMDRNMGIWSGGGSGLTLVARTGDIAPGTGDNASFSKFRGTPALNNAGQTAFLGELFDMPNSGLGIWSEGGGSGLALVARAGNVAPDTGGASFSSFSTPALNNAGQTAFLGSLTGTGVGNSNDRGIWAEDLSGVLKLIAREGDMLDIDDGPGTVFRTIIGLSFAGNTGNGDGRPSGFNNLGQLVFSATFTDGTNGIFVSNLVAIPEPSTLLLGALATLGVLLNRKRQSNIPQRAGSSPSPNTQQTPYPSGHASQTQLPPAEAGGFESFVSYGLKSFTHEGVT